MSDQRSVIHVHTFLRPPDLKIGTPALPIFVGKLCIKSAIRIFFFTPPPPPKIDPKLWPKHIRVVWRALRKQLKT
jgi:hypothetical protein